MTEHSIPAVSLGHGSPMNALAGSILQRYRASRVRLAWGTPRAVVHIGAEQTTVAAGTGDEPETVATLGIGWRKTATEYFRHEPPTPGEMEQAIKAVEDELMRVRPAIPPGSTLLTTDASVTRIAQAAGLRDPVESSLSLEAVEHTFDRLAAVTLGRPASIEGLPAGAGFAATLLILREFMHHLKFASIQVISWDRSGAAD